MAIHIALLRGVNVGGYKPVSCRTCEICLRNLGSLAHDHCFKAAT
jgi:uncharacterized protein (DUF1697 family)